MKLTKENTGKEVSKKVYLYADTIIETAYTAACKLTEEQCRDIVQKEKNLDVPDADIMTHEELAQLTAAIIAMDTWYSKWYQDLNVDDEALWEYFFNWAVAPKLF
jgi:hypothetical protein